MKNAPVTIKDIARTLNISISTVSRALRGLPEIHPDTRNSVKKLAEELDYQPNQLAKNLVKSRTKTIGVVFPNLSYHYFSAMLNNLEETAMQAGYSVLVTQTNESYVRETVCIENLLRSRVEGLIISLSRDTVHLDHVEKLIKRGIPVILVDRTAESLAATRVIVDNQAAAFKATEHLIRQGCRRIGFLAGPAQLALSRQRVDGYLKAAAEYPPLRLHERKHYRPDTVTDESAPAARRCCCHQRPHCLSGTLCDAAKRPLRTGRRGDGEL